MKKKQIFIVPHTHWDREWMFSEQTGNVLLNQMINELSLIMEEQKDFKMVLDGQASLVEDYLRWNVDKKDKIIEKLKKSKVSLGPWYSQPDVFSSMGETTIRNIEIGKKTIEKMGITPMKTAYMPDTFGFNQNLPQIFLKNGLKNFIHWRGLNREQIKDFPLYMWEGIDGSRVISSNYKKGYYHLGMYYPYRGLNNKNIEALANKFIEKTSGTMREWFEAQKIGDSILFPLGGDQAPAEYNAKRFFEMVNKKQDEFEWIITSNFDDFFDKYRKEKLIVHKGDLRTPIAGRIHRTIASARYDIKSLFRRCETNLYYKLEPLEIMYKNIDSSYDFDEYKLNSIIKPLLKLQAHDSLGGCNTDVTNDDIIAKLKQVDRRITSIIDLITYKLLQKNGLRDSKNTINVINQAPFAKTQVKIMTIYSNKPEINVSSDKISILTLKKKQIGFNTEKGIYKLTILLKMKNLDKFKYDINEIDEMNSYNPKVTNSKLVEVSGKNIVIKDPIRKTFKFNLTKDEGDNYDYSPSRTDINFKQTHKIIEQFEVENSNITKIETRICTKNVTNKFITTITSYDGKHDIKIDVDNKLVGYRVSIKFLGTNEIQKSQHLVISKFNDLDETNEWKKDMHEYPALVDYNDGLIQMIGKEGYNIYTSGNNEIHKNQEGVELVLYRTQEFVSRPELLWRPGSASGISYEEESISSKLLKKLSFKLRIDNQDPIEGLNDWNFKPIIHYKNSVHLTAHVHNKFEINDIEWKAKNDIPLPIIEHKKLFISSMRIEDNKIKLRVSNMINKTIKSKITVNNNSNIYEFKPYEYKDII